MTSIEELFPIPPSHKVCPYWNVLGYIGHKLHMTGAVIWTNPSEDTPVYYPVHVLVNPDAPVEAQLEAAYYVDKQGDRIALPVEELRVVKRSLKSKTFILGYQSDFWFEVTWSHLRSGKISSYTTWARSPEQAVVNAKMVMARLDVTQIRLLTKWFSNPQARRVPSPPRVLAICAPFEELTIDLEASDNG